MSDPVSVLDSALRERRALRRPENRKRLIAALRRAAPAFEKAVWTVVAERLPGAIDATLTVPVGGLIVAACDRATGAAKDGEGASAGPETPRVVPIFKLAFEHVSHPTIDIVLEAVTLTVTFEVTLLLDITGVELTLERGRVSRIATGGYKASEKIGVKGLGKPLTFDTPNFKLPGEVLIPERRRADG